MCVGDEDIYDVSNLASAWSRDMDWLSQNWHEVEPCPVVFLVKETRIENLSAGFAKFRHDQLAMEILGKFEVAALATKYSLPTSYKLAILPVNSHSMYWTLIMVLINKEHVEVHFYDPLNSSTHFKELQGIWTGNMLPFLQKWDKPPVVRR
ncbi:hypothetical protein PHMEG_00012315 [Phytophthora megakarya]|uniref:Ubiquitin-like protease family profile domain-containing protein n=1 Tax=Phytophthora megakarya TaxID=4795 RepID=A0A225WA22_9STRA|nr:hypothetical protein PHMEG_00012315 [Phytophthora megakarya]